MALNRYSDVMEAALRGSEVPTTCCCPSGCSGSTPLHLAAAPASAALLSSTTRLPVTTAAVNNHQWLFTVVFHPHSHQSQRQQ